MAGGSTKSGQATLPTPNSTSSFWHTQPSKILLGHRTTDQLPTKADMVIIGSGIAGAFAAHYLAGAEHEDDVDVVMLEAREACWGATGRNGGHCQPKLYSNPGHIARFELDNFLSIRSLIMENNIDCDWRDVVSCHGYCSASMFATEAAAVDLLRSTDPDLADMITVVTSKSSDPSLGDLRLGEKVVGAITGKKAASLWPYKLVAWILERLVSRSRTRRVSMTKSNFSFNLQTNTPVTRLQQLEDGNWIVHTSRGMIGAKQVLLATNAYTSHLLPEFSDLIVPVKGEMSALIPPPALCPGSGAALVDRNSYGFYGRGEGNFSQDDYLVQRPFSNTQETESRGGELMFGGGREYAAGLGVGISDDSDIDQLAADYLRQALNDLLDIQNNGTELNASHEWSGIMGFSRDGRPWVGEVPKDLGGDKGLWMCAGFTGHGMPNASLCAKAVVKEMMGQHLHDKDLPEEFHVSVERAIAARTLVEVSLADILEDEVPLLLHIKNLNRNKL